MTKIGKKTNEIMCVIVINGIKIPKEKELVEAITTKFNNVKTIVKKHQYEKIQIVILGKENINLYGDGYITDKLGEYNF